MHEMKHRYDTPWESKYDNLKREVRAWERARHIAAIVIAIVLGFAAGGLFVLWGEGLL